MVLGHTRCKICSDFFPGWCSGGHHSSHIVSILTCVCTIWPPRTWSTDMGMFHRPLLKAATHHRYIVPNMYSNPSICPSSFPQVYNARSNGRSCSTEVCTCRRGTVHFLKHYSYCLESQNRRRRDWPPERHLITDDRDK